jgi:hypothetical protein
MRIQNHSTPPQQLQLFGQLPKPGNDLEPKQADQFQPNPPPELHPLQVLKLAAPRLAIPIAACVGAGQLASHLPAVAGVVAPGAGYLAAGVLGGAAVMGLSGGAGFSPVLGILMAGGLGVGALACWHNASAVGQVLLQPPAMIALGSIIGMGALVVALAKQAPSGA